MTTSTQTNLDTISTKPNDTVANMPTDDEIIYDWLRHDAFRFRSVLMPILLMLLIIIGQWTSSPWAVQMTKRASYFRHWGDIDDIIRQVWGLKVLFFGLGPILTVIIFNPIQSRTKMRAVVVITLSALFLQAMALLNTNKNTFLFSQCLSSFAFGLALHSIIITLLNWFPDFSIFVFASISLVAMLSHWVNLRFGVYIADIFSLPTLPIFQAILFMATVIPLHFFIQSPPTYIPLFIRSMLHAASLPTSSTLPLPTTLGVAARIPRALGKLQQWKKKLKSKGARRGYGELVNEEDIDQIEEIEMQVASGFDLQENDALDDLYSPTATSGNASKSDSTKRNNNSINNNRNITDTNIITNNNHKFPNQVNNPTSSNNNSINSFTDTKLSQIVVHSQDDVLIMAAAPTELSKSHHSKQNQQNKNNFHQSGFSRAGDEEDNGDPQFALDDDENDNNDSEFEGAADFYNNNNNNDNNNHNNNNNNNNNNNPNTSTIQQHQKQEIAYPNHVINQTDFNPAQIHNNFDFDQHDDNNNNNNNNTSSPINYRHNVGSALSAVVSQLEQYDPLTMGELLGNKQVIIFLLASIAPLLFPFLLIYLTPTVYYHLQNRSIDETASIFNTTFIVVTLCSVLLLFVAQFLGNKGLLTTSTIFILLATLLWSPCSIIGDQYDPTKDITQRSHNPLHIIIGILYIGTMTYTFLLFPALQKYFHDENVRILSAFIIFSLSLTYIFSPVLLNFRNPILEQAAYSPGSKIAINALAYNWVARTGFVLAIFAVFLLYRLRPLAVNERRYKSNY